MSFIRNAFNLITTNYSANVGAITTMGVFANINDSNYFSGAAMALVSAGLLYHGYKQVFGNVEKTIYHWE